MVQTVAPGTIAKSQWRKLPWSLMWPRTLGLLGIGVLHVQLDLQFSLCLCLKTQIMAFQPKHTLLTLQSALRKTPLPVTGLHYVPLDQLTHTMVVYYFLGTVPEPEDRKMNRIDMFKDWWVPYCFCKSVDCAEEQSVTQGNRLVFTVRLRPVYLILALVRLYLVNLLSIFKNKTQGSAMRTPQGV